jgi:lycopene cyclase domain-containing protein
MEGTSVALALGGSLLVGVELASRSATGDPTGPLAGRLRSGSRRAQQVGYAVCWATLVCALWAGVSGLVPPSVPVVVAVFLLLALVSAVLAPERTTATLGYGTWITVAALLGGAVTAPLSSLPLPDIGVLGRYTYLATEVAFGSLALGLLLRAGVDALRSALRTVAVVYPLAYVWDWYTLTVDVFAVTLRTGVEFVGIPVEEHLFMVVVPGLVLAVHETLQRHDTA